MGVKFSVNIKPTHSNNYIHYYSHLVLHVKKGVMCGLFLRALRISSPEYLNLELDILRTAFRKLGYPLFLIHDELSSDKLNFMSLLPLPYPP